MPRLALLALAALGARAMIARPSVKGNNFGGVQASGLNQSQVSAKAQAWIKSKVAWIPINTKPQFLGDTTQQTVIVTHAGKNHQEYIDMTIMLGRALENHAPDVPKVAMIIAGMRLEYQVLLRQAGWHVLKVDDVDPCSDGIQHCDDRFQYRWKDSFEKLNIFRLPFGRVLFLDADTYVFNDGINLLLNSTVVPDGHVAMAPDGCKTNQRTGETEYNSGVMVFKPSLDTFQTMLEMVSVRSGDDMLDQNIINEVFQGKVVELDKKFDCIDPVGVPPGLKKPCKKEHICKKHEVVISHFTGMFKPTKANPFYLRLVQQPESFTATCENTNHGGCQKWAEYYCAMHQQRKHLTPELQEALTVSGGCCLGRGHQNPECAYATTFNNVTDGCPRVIDFSRHDAERSWMSEYYITNKPSTAFHDYRPIYRSVDKELGMHIYYIASKRNWVIGPSPDVDLAVSYAHADALCPHDANHWKLLNGGYIWQAASSISLQPSEGACPVKLDVQAATSAPMPEGTNTSHWMGTYTLTNLVPQSMHGGKPIYEKEATPESPQTMYMFFQQAKGQWVIGSNYRLYTDGAAFTKGEAFCPKENLEWQIRGPRGHFGETLLISDITGGDFQPIQPAASASSEAAQWLADLANKKTASREGSDARSPAPAPAA